MDMLAMNPIKPIIFFLCLIISSLFFDGTGLARPGNGTGASQKWAVVNGFRSAHFGMTEFNVKQAIKDDFGIGKQEILRNVNTNQKTVSLGIKVEKLLPDSGTAQVFYILGYKSKRLIEIKVIWGRPVTENPDPEVIVATANQLKNHFVQKKYKKEGFIVNTQVGEGVILVFQGKDRKGRIVRLMLTNPKFEGDVKVNKNITLTLSYVEKPLDPDIFQIKEGEF